MSKQRPYNNRKGLGYVSKTKKKNINKKEKPAQEKIKKVNVGGNAPKAMPLIMTTRELIILTILYLKILMVMCMLNMLVLAMAMLIDGTQFGYQKILLLLQRSPSIDGFLNPLLEIGRAHV